ncbi:hypothetical protein MP638_002669 [Amoeboaphelidium occidentale]|nr:hypothetical protein MP638_002669 [Amoeboaphelidium occidentale]
MTQQPNFAVISNTSGGLAQEIPLSKDVYQLDVEAKLNQIQGTLNQITATLNNHTETLNQHTDILNKHTVMLEQLNHQMRVLPARICKAIKEPIKRQPRDRKVRSKRTKRL